MGAVQWALSNGRLLNRESQRNIRFVNMPELKALRAGNPDAWDEAFHLLWPTAFAVVQLKLSPFCPADVEDVAIEALEELVEKVETVKSVDELKPLLAGIAHNRSVSLLRERFAKKRGSGKVESLDVAPNGHEDTRLDPPAPESSLDGLNSADLANLLTGLLANLKPDHRAVLEDFFLNGLSYAQISSRRGLALGTVGVYLKRGLEAIREAGGEHPELLKELEAFLR